MILLQYEKLECGLYRDEKKVFMQIRKLIINMFKNGDQCRMR